MQCTPDPKACRGSTKPLQVLAVEYIAGLPLSAQKTADNSCTQLKCACFAVHALWLAASTLQLAAEALQAMVCFRAGRRLQMPCKPLIFRTQSAASAVSLKTCCQELYATQALAAVLGDLCCALSSKTLSDFGESLEVGGISP